MSILTRLSRRFLAKRGIVAYRIEPPIPTSFREYLGRLKRTSPTPAAFLVLGGDPRTLADISSVFPPDKITSFFQIDQLATQAPGKDASAPFIAAIDAETFDLAQIAQKAPWVLCAKQIFITSTLGFYWCGKGDLTRLASFMDDIGFTLVDALNLVRPGFMKAPSERVMFAFRPAAATIPSDDDSRQRRRRFNEALANLSIPIARSECLAYLAGRGSFGYPGGVLNPGAISDGGRLLILSRGEAVPWTVQQKSERAFMSACRPVLMTLDRDCSITHVAELAWAAPAERAEVRFEDFRLFHHEDRLFANHSALTIPGRRAGRNRPLDIASVRSRVAISEVFPDDGKMRLLGYPALDRPVAAMEKNWAMFVHGGEVHLIYSIEPYVVLRAADWPRLKFTTLGEWKLPLPFGGDDGLIRNSVNPVEYDGDYLLHVVHKVFPGKHYAFWAVLIDRRSLQPSYATARPLVCGWRSAPAAIIYACSVIARATELVLFAGLNDSSEGFWRIPRSALDREWISLSVQRSRHSCPGRPAQPGPFPKAFCP